MKKRMSCLVLAAGLFMTAFSGGRAAWAGDGSGPDRRKSETASVRPLPLDKDTQWVVTVHFVNADADVVTLNYRLYEKGVSTKTAMVLMETLKRKMAEKGFHYRKTGSLPKVVNHEYAVLIGADMAYSENNSSLKRKDGNLMIMVMEKGRAETVDVPVSPEGGMEYGEIVELSDEIVCRLSARLFI